MSNAKVMPAPVEEYQKLLEQDFPELKISSIKYLGSGWDNAAMLVNEQYVFRFPRGIFEQGTEVKTEEIEKEVNVLHYLKDKVSFTVPEPTYVAPNFRYFGYQLIPGTLWDQLGEAEQFSDELLRSWVERRTEISKIIPAHSAGSFKVPSYRTNKNEELVKEYITDPAADPRVKEMAQAAMDYVLTRLSDSSLWVFLHEDLQMSNLMVDRQNKKICGIIDWLESEIGPVEAEFYFWSKYGKSVLEKIAQMQEEYDGTKIDMHLARAIHQFYIVADYVDFTKRGFTDSAQHKWSQIKKYLEE